MDSLALSLFLFTIIYHNTFSSYASHLSYTDYCASVVPNSTPNFSKFKVFPPSQLHHGYYIGGIYRRDGQKHFSLEIKNAHETDVAGILYVGAWFTIRTGTWYHRVHHHHENMWNNNHFPRFLTFSLDGFWSESSGMLCMVGTETDDTPQLELLEVVLKLYNVVSSRRNISTLITGSLESTSSEHEVSYFEPISLFIFPTIDYEFTLDAKETKKEYAGEGEVIPGFPINPVRFCSNISSMIDDIYDLQYQSECNAAKNCSPIGGDANKLPSYMSVNSLVCSDVKQRVKILMEFGNYNSGSRLSFHPNSTLVGEGWWDEEKNQLSVAVCHILGMEESIISVHVGDCSTRVSMRFPMIWSINDASSIMGHIWSIKSSGDSSYFKRIVLKSHQDKREIISGIKYEYRFLEKVRKYCPRQRSLKNKGIGYPDVYSSDMKFDMGVEYREQIIAWGFSIPFAVNDQLLNLDQNSAPNSSHTQQFISSNSSLYNVSYQIGLGLTLDAKLGEKKSLFSATQIDVDFSAEGIYNAEAGTLCMVGCRNLGSQNQIPTTDFLDCEILVLFQFQQSKSKNSGAYIRGSIKSMRNNSDPLYFNPLKLNTIVYYITKGDQILRKVYMERIMSLVWTTLLCVFVAFQLYHVKRNPDTVPLIFFVMLSITTFGKLISLVLNFHSFFSQNDYAKKKHLFGEWLALTEVSVMIISMITLLLLLQLLKLTWSARKTGIIHKGLLIAKIKKVLCVIFPLHVAGLLCALLVFRNSTTDV
ncbi:hypothetical protein VNO78_06444 [Psophocarpus tetragonolobus]|uniref:RING-type E3 ubiquitin transferase n=1 Tax=Psophocarpus tetragonolobus TaxID=3891 RepID=A0AAN9SV83_PSOTE